MKEAEVPAEAKLVAGIDDHLDEDNDSNIVGIVFACIGFFILSSVTGYILFTYVCKPRMGGNKGSTVLVNQSNRSDSRTAGQSKLDDIM